MSDTRKTYPRWLPVVAGIFIQICLGAPYIWSIFEPKVVDALSWDSKGAALTYSLLLGLLGIGGVIGGFLQKKLGTRGVIIVSGIVMSAGFFLASLATPSFPQLMWLTYGVMAGLGMGAAYSVTISVCQRWFPDKKGLITGVIVAALGAGGIVFTFVVNAMMTSMDVMGIFAVMAVIFLVTTVVCALFIKDPPDGYAPEGWAGPKQGTGKVVHYTPGQMLRTNQFYLIVLAFILASAAGSMVIPFAKRLGMESGLTESVAAAGVIIISIFNSLGRLCWGALSDRIGRKNTLVALFLVAAVGVFIATFVSGYAMLVMIGVVAFTYGGFLGVFPSFTSDCFGTKHTGVNYGLVMIGFGIGVVGWSFLVGAFKDNGLGFTTPFIIAAAAALAGAVVMLFLKPPVSDKKA